MFGVGAGFAYTPTINHVTNSFSSSRGLATGLTMSGYTAGAMLYLPLSSQLMGIFEKNPLYVGTNAAIPVTNDGAGKLTAIVDGCVTEVFSIVSTADNSGLSHLLDGIYVSGSGSSGAATSVGILGAICGGIMLACSRRLPLNSNSTVETGSTHHQTLLSAQYFSSYPQVLLLGSLTLCAFTTSSGLLYTLMPAFNEVSMYGN
jgi:hypothetical protein